MFYQKVNRRSREAMTGFLARHYRYNTMNSLNCFTSYANNVKIQNLDIPSELQDLAYDVASGEVEAPDWDIFFARTVSDFYQRTGYHIGFNGRSSGYLVLYEAQANNPVLSQSLTIPWRFSASAALGWTTITSSCPT